jgi:hypothetical protein
MLCYDESSDYAARYQFTLWTRVVYFIRSLFN